jgi:hypothetical protein
MHIEDHTAPIVINEGYSINPLVSRISRSHLSLTTLQVVWTTFQSTKKLAYDIYSHI